MGVKGHLDDRWGDDIYLAPCGRAGVKHFLDFLFINVLNTFTWSVTLRKMSSFFHSYVCV